MQNFVITTVKSRSLATLSHSRDRTSLLEASVRGAILLGASLLLVLGAMVTTTQPQTWQPRSIDQLAVQTGLPDPLIMADGTRVVTGQQWEQRRKEIKAMLLYHQYGRMPLRPDQVTATVDRSARHASGKGSEQWITLSIGSKHKLKMRAVLYLPDKRGPRPVVIREEGSLGRTREASRFLEKGYMFVEYARHDLDPDQKGVIGPAQKAYPKHDWATLAVWAWGGMRLIDYLETRDDVDMQRIAITGHSRGGKMALLAGALDERISLVVPNGSGAGGAGSYRVLGPGAESLSMNDKPHWYHARILQFVDKIDRLPFDQHFLKALVAPRLLLCTESVDDEFANPQGTQATSIAANKVYEFLKADKTRNGLRYRRGKHDFSAEDWQTLLDFAEWHFFGRIPAEPSSFWMTPFPLPRQFGGGKLGRRVGPTTEKSNDGSSVRGSAAKTSRPGGWTKIGAAGNEADENYFGRGRYGAVAYDFEIATTKVTNDQYAEFLNAVGQRDANGLYHPGMSRQHGGIERVVSQGRVKYVPKRGWEHLPVNHVSWYDALRFCNWLHNGKPAGPQNAQSTEDGAYLFSGPTRAGKRKANAKFYLPSEHEWYKAAYFRKDRSYGLFRRDTSQNLSVKYRGLLYDSVLVDIRDGWEWNEAHVSNLFRGLRSGAWFLGNNKQSAGRFYSNAELQLSNIGFRVAKPTLNQR